MKSEKKKLNLDKIKLYCILHNIKNWWEVPQCRNCMNFAKCPIQSNRRYIKVSVHYNCKDFYLGWENARASRKFDNIEVCNKWKKK